MVTENISKEDAFTRSALRMLARRSLTVKELTDRLHKKGAGKQLAERIALDCLGKGYIDEHAIAEDHIGRGRDYKCVGRFLLRYELKQRGIREDMIDETLDELYPERDEMDVARRFSARRMRGMEDLPVEKRERRLSGSLQRRGFQQNVIAAVIYEIRRSAKGATI